MAARLVEPGDVVQRGQTGRLRGGIDVERPAQAVDHRDDVFRRIGPADPQAAETIDLRSEEHTSELQSLMRISYAVFCLKKKRNSNNTRNNILHTYNIQADNN